MNMQISDAYTVSNSLAVLILANVDRANHTLGFT